MNLPNQVPNRVPVSLGLWSISWIAERLATVEAASYTRSLQGGIDCGGNWWRLKLVAPSLRKQSPLSLCRFNLNNV